MLVLRDPSLASSITDDDIRELVEQRFDDHTVRGLRYILIKSGLARDGQDFFQFHIVI